MSESAVFTADSPGELVVTVSRVNRANHNSRPNHVPSLARNIIAANVGERGETVIEYQRLSGALKNAWRVFDSAALTRRLRRC